LPEWRGEGRISRVFTAQPNVPAEAHSSGSGEPFWPYGIAIKVYIIFVIGSARASLAAQPSQAHATRLNYTSGWIEGAATRTIHYTEDKEQPTPNEHRQPNAQTPQH
jgi:hypothetical protein